MPIDLRLVDYFRKAGRLSTPEEQLLARYPQLAKPAPPDTGTFDVVNNSATARGYMPPPGESDIPEMPAGLDSEMPAPPPAPPARQPRPAAAPAAAKGPAPKAGRTAGIDGVTTAALVPPSKMTREPILQERGADDILGEEYGDEKRKALYESLKERRLGTGMAAILAGISGKKDAAKGVIDSAAEREKTEKEDFEKGRKAKMEDFDLDRKAKAAEREDIDFTEKQAELRMNRDPKSAVSQAKQELAAQYSGKPVERFRMLSGEQIDKVLPIVEKAYQAKTSAELRKAMSEGSKEEQYTRMIRDRVTGSKAYNRYQEIAYNADKIEQAARNPGAFGDLSVMFSYMKALDPESVVREGEQVLFRQTGNLPQSVANSLNKLVSGKTLQPSQREEILRFARGFKQLSRDQFNHYARPHLEQAKRMGLSLSEIDPMYGDSPAPAAGSSAPEGKITVTNGTETLYIDPADEEEAAKEGFRRI